MRLIDADAIEELFRETINHIAKNPKMEGNLEHMVRASAMVIEMIKDAPTIEPQKWIPFRKRELTEEEQEMYPEWSYYLDCELPEDGEEILISSPTWGVYKDTFNNEGSDGCYLEGDEEIDDGMAWMPLPEPWKGDNNAD